MSQWGILGEMLVFPAPLKVHHCWTMTVQVIYLKIGTVYFIEHLFPAIMWVPFVVVVPNRSLSVCSYSLHLECVEVPLVHFCAVCTLQRVTSHMLRCTCIRWKTKLIKLTMTQLIRTDKNTYLSVCINNTGFPLPLSCLCYKTKIQNYTSTFDCIYLAETVT